MIAVVPFLDFFFGRRQTQCRQIKKKRVRLYLDLYIWMTAKTYGTLCNRSMVQCAAPSKSGPSKSQQTMEDDLVHKIQISNFSYDLEYFLRKWSTTLILFHL